MMAVDAGPDPAFVSRRVAPNGEFSGAILGAGLGIGSIARYHCRSCAIHRCLSKVR